MTLTFDRLRRAVAEDAAIRRVQRLQPVGGPGDKLFPPTYPGDRNNDPPRHVFERRRIAGQDTLCVLIDSVQSQANRLEEALKAARDAKALSFPAIAVDFAGTEVEDIGKITTLDAPHRVFDAIIRDSELNGTRFKETEAGKRLVAAKSHHARSVYELSPTALVFGAWNSTGEGGGLGAKFPRCVVSEIVGVGVATEREVARSGEVLNQPSGRRTGSRIDPLGIRSGVSVYKLPNGDWSLDVPADKKAKNAPKEVRPSEINHSNIRPSVTSLGVTVDYALHVFVLSFAALRRLHFVGNSGVTASAGDLAAQTALAALGLVAAASQDRSGYFLRSRCDLVPEDGTQRFEIVRASGKSETMEFDFDDACRLLKEAADAARGAGIAWSDHDLVLKPQDKLVRLVAESRRLALQGEAEVDEEG